MKYKMYTPEEQKWFLKLARQAIAEYFETAHRLNLQPDQIWECGKKMGACFVTLTTNEFELRGCIGSLEAREPLYLDVMDNAIAAAFKDDRFYPLPKNELDNISISVSVLTPPQKLDFSSPDDLLNKLTVGVDGVVVKKGGKSATYLPMVWDEMLEKHNFLSSLCLKAGLEPDDWQKPGLSVETYRVESFSE